MDIDINALNAARRETAGDPEEITVSFKDGSWVVIVDELSYAFAEAAAMGQYRLAVYEMLGEENGIEFFDLKPSIDDVKDLVDKLGEAYTARSLGNSSASKSSSANTSRPSKSSSPKATPDSPASPSASGDPDA